MTVKKLKDCLVIDVNKSGEAYTFNILCVNKVLKDLEVDENISKNARERMFRQLRNANKLNEFLNITIEQLQIEDENGVVIKNYIKNVSQ